MADYIEREPLLKAFKEKCCQDCPGGYSHQQCHSWCDAASEIELIENAPAVNNTPQQWQNSRLHPPEDSRDVIAYRDGIGSVMGFFDHEIHKRWLDANTCAFLDNVTHWMEKPEDPEKTEEGDPE